MNQLFPPPSPPMLLEVFPSRRARGLFQCACGKKFMAYVTNVKIGRKLSCGCYRRMVATAIIRNQHPLNITHGCASREGRIPEYFIWCGIIQRCFNPKGSGYKYYGGRGISVCKEWQDSFEQFLADMGRRPSPKHSIDRINNDGNYEPGNCRWATALQQARNKRQRNQYSRAVPPTGKGE